MFLPVLFSHQSSMSAPAAATAVADQSAAPQPSATPITTTVGTLPPPTTTLLQAEGPQAGDMQGQQAMETDTAHTTDHRESVQGDVPQAEDTPVATEQTQRTKRPRGRRPAQGSTLNWSMDGDAQRALQHASLQVALETIAFDTAMQYGQPRLLDGDIVEQRLQELRGCPPMGVIRDILLLATDRGGKGFVVLGGQHMVKALQILQQEALDAGRHLPPYLRHVRAQVLHYATPRAVCEQWAGAHQCRQNSVAAMPLSRWCEAYLRQGRQHADPNPTAPTSSSSTSSSSATSATSGSSTSSTQQGDTADPGSSDRAAQLAAIIRATAVTGMKRYPTDVCAMLRPCTLLAVRWFPSE